MSIGGILNLWLFQYAIWLGAGPELGDAPQGHVALASKFVFL